METLSLLAVNALNGGGGGGGGDVTPDGVTTEFNASEELQANAVIHVNALPSSNIKANSLYHVTETVTYTDEEEVEHTFSMGKLFRYESGEWVSYTTVSGLSEADYDHLTSAQKNDGSTYVLSSGHVVRTSTATINGVEVVGDLTGTDLELVNEDDFVTTPTGKTDGMEFVLPVGTPTSPIVLSEIDDSAAMRYSTVHTSSNDYINHKLDAINESLVGKLSIQFVAELPASPTRNTQYYVETDTDGVWDIYVVDNSGTVRSMGSTELDTDGFVTDTRRVAGIALSADVSAQQIEDATKSLTSTLTNKTIDADSNTISNVEVGDLKASAVATAIGSSPVNTKLTTEKAVSDALAEFKQVSLVNENAVTFNVASPITNLGFWQYAQTTLFKCGKMCFFTGHFIVSKTSNSPAWVNIGSLPDGYKPVRATPFVGTLQKEGGSLSTVAIGGHINSQAIFWYTDGASGNALDSCWMRIVCVYECA